MKTLSSITAAVSLLAASAALAQTSPPSSPSTTSPPAATTPAPSGTTGSTAQAQPDYKMTDAEAGAWVDKPVYSSDNQNLGEVAAIQRDTSGKVTELHADIGGFLGLGETRVRVTPSQFKFNGDRIMLNMTAEQARQLPKIGK